MPSVEYQVNRKKNKTFIKHSNKSNYVLLNKQLVHKNYGHNKSVTEVALIIILYLF